MLSLYYLFDWNFADQKFFVFHKAKCARTINWVRLLEFVQCWIKLNDSFIHLILTNSHNSFQNSITIQTGLSDFHKMTAVIKLKFEELKFRIIHYWNYKNFPIIRLESTCCLNCSKFPEELPCRSAISINLLYASVLWTDLLPKENICWSK